MPSPIAHVAAGYALYLGFQRLQDTRKPPRGPDAPMPFADALFVATAAMSLAPDLDSVVGLISGNFGRFHNNATHSLLVGVGFALLIGVLARSRRAGSFRFWFAAALACYEVHVLLDYLTWGRGVMLVWPFSDRRFGFPWPIFYGLHWSQGLVSVQHLWTALTESVFALLILFAAHGRSLTPGRG